MATLIIDPMDIAPVTRSAVSDSVFAHLVDEILSGRVAVDDATGKVKIDYRPVHDYTMTNDIAPIPPKARVY